MWLFVSVSNSSEPTTALRLAVCILADSLRCVRCRSACHQVVWARRKLGFCSVGISFVAKVLPNIERIGRKIVCRNLDGSAHAVAYVLDEHVARYPVPLADAMRENQFRVAVDCRPTEGRRAKGTNENRKRPGGTDDDPATAMPFGAREDDVATTPFPKITSRKVPTNSAT